MADLLPRLMTQEEARDCLDDIRVGTLKVKERLIELHERRGWEALSYPSWRECIEAELQISKSTAYRLLDAAYIQRGLSQNGKSLPDSHAMELKKVEPEKRAAALAKAKESAAAQGRAKPTAKDIREAVDLGSGTKPPHDATHQDDAEPRRAATDGEQLQQGEDDDGQVSRDDVLCNSPTAERESVDVGRAVSRYGKGENSRRAENACPHGGAHQPLRESGETYCQKCFEPLDESDESQDAFDFEAVDETCQFWIDNCPLSERVKLSNSLKVWAQKAKETK